MCLLVSAIPSYADQYVTIEVGETKTISLPSDIAMKDIHTSNWVCTDYQYIEVLNSSKYSITIKGLKGPNLPNQVWIRCDYYYCKDGTSHSDTHTIRVTVLDHGGQGPNTGEELPYGDDKNIPSTGVYDYGWAGDYTVYEGNEVMVSANFNPSYVPYYSSYKWTSRASFNYTISYKGGNYCIIKGMREGTSKLYCYAISDTGNSSHMIYYDIKVIKPVDVENITLNQDKLVLSPESTYKLEATFFPSNANVNTSIAWNSDNTTVATVDSKGNVTAKGLGTATIVAKTGNGKIAKCEVIVRKPVVVSAHAGRYHSIIVKSDGSLWSCGRNNKGQLGDSKTFDRNKFVKVMDDVASVYAGNDYSLVVKRDNSLWNFGDNSQGALGDGTDEHIYMPKNNSSLIIQ